MDFKIIPGGPDGIAIEARFYAEDWRAVREIMEALESVEDGSIYIDEDGEIRVVK